MINKVAFVGNPNVGKSAIINTLSNGHLKVGNWSGVTTQKVSAFYTYQNEEFEVIDLPGLYGLNHKSDEERITEQYLMNEHIDCIVNVLDSTSLINNMYLTLEIRDLQIPMVLVLNFDDERIKNDIEIDIDKLSRRLSIPLIQYNALNPKNTLELKQKIQNQCKIKAEYHPLLDMASDNLFCALCNDAQVGLKSGILLFKKQFPDLLLQNRIQTIHNISNYISIGNFKILKRTQSIDEILLYSKLAYPALIFTFIILCTVVFQGSKPLVMMIEIFFDQLILFVSNMMIDRPILLQSLIIDGLLTSIKTILSFVPLLALLYFCIALLEESGYMARIAVLQEFLMRKLNLSGKAMISMILGFGCNVPAIASCDSLENERMRRKVSLLIPMMSCGARLPIYFFFIDAFFKQHQVLVLFTLYATGIVVACFFALFMGIQDKETSKSSMMELVMYRMPNFSVVFGKVKRECLSFIKKTFNVIIWVLLIMWALANLPSSNIETSYLAQIAKSISFLFKPLGFGIHWQLVASLIPSFVAKESVVGFIMLVSPDLNFMTNQPQLISFSFMLYCVLSIPCIMTISILRQKYGFKHAMKSVLIMLVTPYVVCFIVYQGISLLQHFLR